MNFSDFELWRKRALVNDPSVLDCAETNLYRSLATLQPRPDISNTDCPVHRCDLARAWLARYGFPASNSRRALVCRGVRHALALIFKKLALSNAIVWIPKDVYPIYLELAHAAGIEPRHFASLPEPKIPAVQSNGGPEYLLVANPWKPLGRYLTEKECDALINWLDASPHRHLIVDCVYDLSTPFHATTQKLQKTGRMILLHSVTKGWLWPKTFGVTLIGDAYSQFESLFRDDSPSFDQLRLAHQLLSTETSCPNQVIAALQNRKNQLLAAIPDSVRESLLLKPEHSSPGCYFFPVWIPAEELLKHHNLLALPGSTFGADWNGSILTSLASVFAPIKNGST